jgi:hypothetical protein
MQWTYTKSMSRLTTNIIVFSVLTFLIYIIAKADGS